MIIACADVVARATTPTANAAITQRARIGRITVTTALTLRLLMQRIHIKYHLYVVDVIVAIAVRVFFFFDTISYFQRVFQYEYQIFSIDL